MRLRAKHFARVLLGLVLAGGSAATTSAQTVAAAPPPSGTGKSATSLAQELTNPLAAIISVPIQLNYDQGYGDDHHGSALGVNIEPVVPISLNSDWNIISRAVIPIERFDVVRAEGTEIGLGDIQETLFLSPKRPVDGFVWGIGPVLSFPTATGNLLGTDQWGAGPSAVIVKMMGHWTLGALVNQLWSVAGPGGDRLNQLYAQPFISHTTKGAWTFQIDTETSYTWNSKRLTVPLNFMVSKLLSIGSQRMSLSAGLRYYATSPDVGPRGFGGRLGVTFLFPSG